MTDRSHTSRGERTAGAGVPGVPSVSGVVETIAAGLSHALWRPRLLVLPIVVDLVLWLGLQVSAQPLTAPLSRFIERRGGENGELAAEQLRRFGEQAHVNDLLGWFIPSLFAGVPRDSLMSSLLAFLAPPLMNGVSREEMFATWGEGALHMWQPGHWATVVGASFALLAMGSVLFVAFLVPLAQSIRGGGGGAVRLLADGALSWLRVVGLILLVTLVGALAIGPVLIATAVLLAFGIDLSAILALTLVFGGGIAAVYTLFAIDAIVVSRVGPLIGLRQSFHVVRANFGTSVRFALTSLLIATGLFQLWQVLVANPPGIILSLLGNAIVGTGLTLASMMFFHDRIRLLQRDSPPVGRDI